MKIPFLGGSYQEKSRPFDYQRTVNLYPVIDETKLGKEVGALYGTPGISPTVHNVVGTFSGHIIALYTSANGRSFALQSNYLSNDHLFELSATVGATATDRGAVVGTNTKYTFAENRTQLAICNGTDLYIFTYATNALVQVTDIDFPGAATVTQQDGYFIINKPDSDQFYISALANGLSWAALDFATAEYSPDGLTRVYSAFGQLWLFGSQTTEVWYNNGSPTFPFARVEGAKMQTGCAAPRTVVENDNSIFWLGQDAYGKGIVYKAQGYSALRISNHWVELKLAALDSLQGLKAYSYQQEGHLFYVLTGGELETALVFDSATRIWCERGDYVDGKWTGINATSCTYAFGKHIVNGEFNVFEMSPDIYTSISYNDFVLEAIGLRRERIFSHIHDEADRVRYNKLQIDFEYGVGRTSGQGENPLAMLRMSDDGGQTWSNEYLTSIGRIGQYKANAVWRRLGINEIMTFWVAISEPVKVSICGAYLE